MVSLANRRSNLILVPLTLVVALATAAPARATPMYSITDLGLESSPSPAILISPTADPTSAAPLAINNNGQVSITPSGSPSGPWEISSGNFTVINFSSGVVGFTYLETGGQQIGLIMPPEANTSTARGVSTTGAVVGYSNGPMYNFVYYNGSFSSLNLSNLTQLSPTSGLDLHGPGIYYGINAQMEVVGTYDYGSDGKHGDVYHAFIASLTPGALGYGGLDLNSLLPPNSGWILTSATGINDAGQIVGYGINPQGKYSGYELTPSGIETPEPGLLAFFGLTFLGLAARKLTRRKHCKRN